MSSLENDITEKLRNGGVENAAFQAHVLLKEITGNDALLNNAVQRLIDGVPLSRVLGHQEFWGLRFDVSPDTLDPRADTETLIDVAIKRFAGNPPKRILDIGTGTGCILISLLHEWPQTLGVGTDIAPGALETARRNAKMNGVADRASFVETSWARGVQGPFDLILSNPPYIASHVIPNLGENVKNHDPILALDGGPDGLNAYRSIITETKALLTEGGILLFEIGYDQGESVPRLVEDSGATPTRLIPDLAGIPRVLECQMGITKKTFGTDS